MTALLYMVCNPNAFEMQKMKKRPEFMEAFIKSEKRPAEKRAEFMEKIKKSENNIFMGFMDAISEVIQDLIIPGKVHLIPSWWSSILHLLNYSFSIFL